MSALADVCRSMMGIAVTRRSPKNKVSGAWDQTKIEYFLSINVEDFLKWSILPIFIKIMSVKLWKTMFLCFSCPSLLPGLLIPKIYLHKQEINRTQECFDCMPWNFWAGTGVIKYFLWMWNNWHILRTAENNFW